MGNCYRGTKGDTTSLNHGSYGLWGFEEPDPERLGGGMNAVTPSPNFSPPHPNVKYSYCGTRIYSECSLLRGVGGVSYLDRSTVVGILSLD